LLDRVTPIVKQEDGLALALGGARRSLAKLVVDAFTLRRVQLAGALLFGIALPTVLTWPVSEILQFLARAGAAGHSPFNTLVGATLAMGFGFVTYRQLKTHPGVETTTYTLYAFAMTFGVLSLVFLLARIDYSRQQLIATFLATVTWFLFVQFVTRKRQVARLAVAPNTTDYPAVPHVGTVDWLHLTSPAIPGVRIGGVVADLRAEHAPDWERFLARCALAGLPVFDVKQISESLTGRVDIQHLSENTLSSTLHGLVYGRLKRAIDLVAVVAALPFFTLAVAVASIAIRLESPGPIFFTQVRVGHRGRRFVIWKLRSMYADAGGDRFTREGDDRITRVGAIIRKYRIDEFPQIWNIAKGEMSWIGPRPEAQELSEWYDREVPFYSYRHIVRPGLTGWAQVNQGNVAKVAAAHEKLQFDFYYIKHFSPWLDLLVVLKTIRTVLTGFGSR
jgi:lipopolysaccharide/colanic/teichoic acid biosynthesis glycosyltransferase